MTNATERRTIQAHSGLPGVGFSSVGEIIPGYELEERIGAGGYGEVWRAKVPGGLAKAVKIVYGTMSERHAVVELKSLERIKDVRHPFILTLERIEVVDGRLVVVTELAEGSLRDRFEDVTEGGAAGIERDHLLRYMHDVADALDYMYEQHSLQHLDIKPENLLLIGGHVKVADFGLTKDLRDNSLSAVAGMTPLYAAPEVFEGKPGRHSDQYSLACVYQYLLTGQPPFRGRTTAQLISQHLHSSPDLTLLPRQEHSAILKALSKDPRKRYDSCSEFVRALETAGRSEEAAPKKEMDNDREKRTPPAPQGPEPSAPRQSALHETDLDSDETDVGSRSPRILRPVPLDDVTFTPRPAVVIGLGGVAGKLLKALQQRLSGQKGTKPALPIRLLYVDTDETDIYEAMYGKDGECLTHGDVLTAPLKRPSDYRRKSKRLMEWIPRRWLFNIPRSQRTEGIRALGRLAFVDRYRELSLAFRKCLEKATGNVPTADPAESEEPEHQPELPRVFIVTATGGGTGSGMAVDAGYAMRRALSALGLEDAGLTGLFLQHDTALLPNATLGVANSLAFLRELGHFNRTGSFPQDADVGIPEAIALPPFDRSYFVRLGADAEDRTGNTLDEAAEYLYRCLTGRSAGVLDYLRGPGAEHQGRPRLNSFVAKVVGGDGADGQPSREPLPLGTWTDLTLDVHKRLLKTRGAARLLIATAGADEEHVAAIKAQCGDFGTIIRDGDDSRTFVCDEIEAVPYGDVLALLESESPDSVEIAEMLTTRTDVEWDT